MTINPANIKVGDKVQLEFTVVKSRHDDRLCFQVSNRELADQFVLFGSKVRNFEIVGHTPAPPPPWVPAVGDIVRPLNSRHIQWEITVIDSDGDWLVRGVADPSEKRLISNRHDFELDSSEI